MNDPTPLENKVQSRANSLVFRWVGPSIGTVALACAGWAHGKISSNSDMLIKHDTLIQTLQAQRDELHADVKALESKIDHLTELLERHP